MTDFDYTRLHYVRALTAITLIKKDIARSKRTQHGRFYIGFRQCFQTPIFESLLAVTRHGLQFNPCFPPPQLGISLKLKPTPSAHHCVPTWRVSDLKLGRFKINLHPSPASLCQDRCVPPYHQQVDPALHQTREFGRFPSRTPGQQWLTPVECSARQGGWSTLRLSGFE